MAQQQLAESSDASVYEISTLYVGNLHPNVTLTSLQDLCACFGLVDNVKVVRDKTSGESAGYAFVKFAQRSGADAALQALHGMDCLGRTLRVNWAFQAPTKDEAPAQFQIFVGDLAQEITDATLFDSFRVAGCTQARVLWDHATGRSKRYGFVSFRSQEAGDAAIAAMHGQYIGFSRVRCRWAQHKQDETKPAPDVASVNRADAVNTNVYVGNVPQSWTDTQLCTHFSAFGPVVEARLNKRGGYAFVRFQEHSAAVMAIVGMQGVNVDGQVLKCSWGRNTEAGHQAPIGLEAVSAPFRAHSAAAAAAAAGWPLGLSGADGMMVPPHLVYPSAGSGGGGGGFMGAAAAAPLPSVSELLDMLAGQQQQNMLAGQLQFLLEQQQQQQRQLHQQQQQRMQWGEGSSVYGSNAIAALMAAWEPANVLSSTNAIQYPYF